MGPAVFSSQKVSSFQTTHSDQETAAAAAQKPSLPARASTSEICATRPASQHPRSAERDAETLANSATEVLHSSLLCISADGTEATQREMTLTEPESNHVRSSDRKRIFENGLQLSASLVIKTH